MPTLPSALAPNPADPTYGRLDGNPRAQAWPTRRTNEHIVRVHGTPLPLPMRDASSAAARPQQRRHVQHLVHVLQARPVRETTTCVWQNCAHGFNIGMGVQSQRSEPTCESHVCVQACVLFCAVLCCRGARAWHVHSHGLIGAVAEPRKAFECRSVQRASWCVRRHGIIDAVLSRVSAARHVHFGSHRWLGVDSDLGRASSPGGNRGLARIRLASGAVRRCRSSWGWVRDGLSHFFTK